VPDRDEAQEIAPALFCPADRPELKYRFGRHLEKLTGAEVFGYRF
jgi:hypothetical protein